MTAFSQTAQLPLVQLQIPTLGGGGQYRLSAPVLVPSRPRLGAPWEIVTVSIPFLMQYVFAPAATDFNNRPATLYLMKNGVPVFSAQAATESFRKYNSFGGFDYWITDGLFTADLQNPYLYDGWGSLDYLVQGPNQVNGATVNFFLYLNGSFDPNSGNTPAVIQNPGSLGYQLAEEVAPV